MEERKTRVERQIQLKTNPEGWVNCVDTIGMEIDDMQWRQILVEYEKLVIVKRKGKLK